MKKILFPLALLVSIVLDAQEFDLNKYKYRFQRYQSAQFNFNFMGSNNYRMDRNAYQSTSPNSPIQHFNSDKNILNISLSLPFNFYRIVNTEKLQQTQSFDLLSQFDANNEVRNTWKYSTQLINYSSNNRFYKGKNFNELNFSLNGRLTSNKVYRDNQASFFNYKNNYKSGGFTLSLGKGKGRLEMVSDAVTTLFILQDLRKKAGIGNYSNEQIENIAKGITSINNTRFIDFRYRLIDQLTLLDSTLKSNGIEPTSAIKYFTTINDNWLYATRFQRYSGSRWSVNYLLTGSIFYLERRTYDNDTDAPWLNQYQNTNLFNGVGFNYAWSKQMGLKTQRSFSASINSGFSFNTQMSRDGINYFSTSKYKPDNSSANLSIEYGYLYQPNSRTFIQFDLILDGLVNNRLYGMRMSNPDHRESYNIMGQLTPQLSIFKFFNPHLYYSFKASAPIYTNHYKNSGDNQLTSFNTVYQMPAFINMGLTYNFF